MKKVMMYTLCMAIVFISSCAIYSANVTYLKPEQDFDENNYSVVLDKTFDEVWSKLIEYSASTFFSIENYEKASGLITLNFGVSTPSDFITGGFWEVNWKNNYTGEKSSFTGDYVDYLVKRYNAKLSGKMNIVVLNIAENKTKVIVKARYIFTSDDSYSADEIYSFDTGNSCTHTSYTPYNKEQDADKSRTICPTYKAENAIINALK